MDSTLPRSRSRKPERLSRRRALRDIFTTSRPRGSRDARSGYLSTPGALAIPEDSAPASETRYDWITFLILPRGGYGVVIGLQLRR